MHSQTPRFPVELGSVRDPDALVGRLHRLAMAGGPCWGLARLLRRGEVPLPTVWCGERTNHGGTTSIEPVQNWMPGSYVVACQDIRSEMGYQGEAGLSIVGNKM